MKYLQFCSILSFFGLVLAGNEEKKEILVKFQPITTEQYESLLKINAGKPIISEGRFISSAIAGLSGLATGFQMGKILPNLFGGNNNQIPKGTVGGYPLCTINANDATARQSDGSVSYINMEELTDALARPSADETGSSVINCVLVLDDSKEPNSHNTTPRPTHRPPRPTTTTKAAPTSTHHPTDEPTNKPNPQPPHYPWYPSYPSNHHPYPPPPPYHPYPPPPPYHPYPPPPPYHPYPPPPHHSYPPPPYYYPYIKYPVYENDDEYKHDDEEYVKPTESPTISIHSFLLDKLQALQSTSTTTTTKPTRKPSRRPTRRPTRHSTHRPTYRPHLEHPEQEYKSQRQTYNVDLDEYDDSSIDYIEVAKKENH